MTFIYGVGSSLVAAIIFFSLVTNRADVAYLLRERGKYHWLENEWHEYHLTRDRQQSKLLPIWVHHVETFNINWFGRITGVSSNRYNKRLDYRIKGSIRDGVMRLRYLNKSTHEQPVVIAFPNLIGTTLLVGAWQGHDFQMNWTMAPIVLSLSLSTLLIYEKSYLPLVNPSQIWLVVSSMTNTFRILRRLLFRKSSSAG